MNVRHSRSNSIARFYEDYWRSPEGLADHKSLRDLREKAHRYAYHLLGDLHGAHVLDVGCGSGDDVVEMTRRNAQVLGIDVAINSLELSKQKLRLANLSDARIRFARMDIESLALESCSFDVVFMNSVLMHVNSSRAIAECRRVATRGGAVIVVEPLRYCLPILLYRKLFSRFETVRPRYLSLSELLKWGRDFSNVMHREFYFMGVTARTGQRQMRHSGPSSLAAISEPVKDKLPWLRELYWITVVKMVK